MTVLTAMQSAAIRLFGQKPQPMFGASGTFELELCDLVNEVAQDIAKYRDWQNLIQIATITGDGTTTVFDLPSDYDRQLQDTDIQQLNTWFWGYYHYTNMNIFLFDQAQGFPAAPGGWIMRGNQIHFDPAPGASTTAVYPYISNNIVRANTDILKPFFTEDTDEFLLPERLLTLGLVWRWRENKKLDASGDQEAFIKALDEYAVKDSGSRIQRRNSSIPLAGTSWGWPWELGTV